MPNIDAYYYFFDLVLTQGRLAISLYNFRRFSRNNMACWKSMDVLIPNTEELLDPIVLKPLYEYAITIPTVQRYADADADTDNLICECKVFKNVLNEKSWEVRQS